MKWIGRLARTSGASLQHANFRLFWVADGLSILAAEIELLILGWFVIVETGSPFLVGTLGALRFSGTLLGPVYGLVADRIDRRHLQVGVKWLFSALALAIGSLWITDNLAIWHIFAATGVAGIARQLEMVVRHAFIPDIIPAMRLMNGLSLQRSMMELMRIVGPLLGAISLTAAGFGVSYVALAIVYAGSALLMGRVRSGAIAARRFQSPLAEFRTALAFAYGHPRMRGALLIAFLVNFTAFPLTQGLMPVVALQLQAGPAGLAILLSSVGVGALIGTLILSIVPPQKDTWTGLVLTALAWHAALLIFAAVDSLAIGLLTLVGFGLAGSATMVLIAAVLLNATGPHLRGRIMGIRSLAINGLPLGLLASGFISEHLGVRTALFGSAVIGLVGTLLVHYASKLRDSRQLPA